MILRRMWIETKTLGKENILILEKKHLITATKIILKA
jgi:hypothetical protein